ncbi:hypothetical protein ACP70R_014489 [Stipagrostis hirtigluma subsp. patula]
MELFQRSIPASKGSLRGRKQPEALTSPSIPLPPPPCAALSPLGLSASSPDRRMSSPPAGLRLLTAQSGQSNEAEVDVDRKMEEETGHLLTILKSAGIEIDDEIARAIDEQIARTKAEAVREAIKEARRNERISGWQRLIAPIVARPATCGFGIALLTILSGASGYYFGVKFVADNIYEILFEGHYPYLGLMFLLNAYDKKKRSA